MAKVLRIESERENQRGIASATMDDDIEMRYLLNRLLGQAEALCTLELSSIGEVREFRWGNPLMFGTAAFWTFQCHLRAWNKSAPSFALGKSLLEETFACLLGGYGMPAELGLAAYRAVKDRELIKATPHASRDEFLEVLREPLQVGTKQMRYRFPAQKAQYLASICRKFAEVTAIPSEPLALRDWLTTIPGIGPKTASWIVRNHTGSNDVAVIDIHIERACTLAGIFSSDWCPSRHYRQMEEAFVGFSKKAHVEATGLDVVMWNQMRVRGRYSG